MNNSKNKYEFIETKSCYINLKNHNKLIKVIWILLKKFYQILPIMLSKIIRIKRFPKILYKRLIMYFFKV